MKAYDYFCILHIRKLAYNSASFPRVNLRLYDSKVPDSSRISPGTSLTAWTLTTMQWLNIIVFPILDEEIGAER